MFYNGSTQGGQHGVALAVKESICKTSKFTREDVNERLMSMRFEISGQHQAVNFVVGYAPTEPSDSEKKRAFWHRLDSLVQRIPKKEALFVLMDANARTGLKIEGERTEDDGVLGAYGRDELNSNGKRLLNFATDNKLAVTNTFFSTRKGGISHTYNGVIGDRAGDFKRIDYILTRQAHRPRVHNVEVHPQPNRQIKADSDHNMVFATVDLGGRLAHNRRVQQTPQPRSFDRSQLKTRFLRERVIRKFLDNIDEIAGQRASVAEEAREFTEAILGAAHAVLPEARRTPHRLGWCERPAVRACALGGAGKKAGGTPTMQVQTHHGNVESTSSCVQGSASGDRQGYRGPLGGVCGGTGDTPPTPRHEGFVQTPENDGGPGREENRGTAGHQGRERQSAAR